MDISLYGPEEEKPVSAGGTDDFYAICQDIKCRPTPQGEAILRALLQANRHITAEEIYRQVSAELPGINSSTVYRWLKNLKKTGLVAAMDFGEHRVFYKHISKASHHHLICHRCGRIIDANSNLLDTVKDQLLEKYHFIAEIKHMVILGECDKCANKESGTIEEIKGDRFESDKR